MCRRYSQKASAKELAAVFEAEITDPFEPQEIYNPKALVPVAVHSRKNDRREIRLFRWGLIPHWAKEEAIGNKLYNARAETLYEKPSFRDSFVQRRCIIPATGFYEWNAENKTLHIVTHVNTPIMAFAGLWDRWKRPNGQIIVSCTIITTAASSVIAPIHHRMPVILDQEAVGNWLNDATPSPALAGLLEPTEALRINS